jgi:ABC-type glycerol-3-phosphate transport system permease component
MIAPTPVRIPVATRVMVITMLIILVLIMLYPFFFMVGTSLKLNTEIYGNRNLIPLAPQTVMVNGNAVPVYEQTIDGKTTQLIKIGAAPATGTFFDPADPTKQIDVPLNQAEIDTDKPRAQFNGRSYPMYNVTVSEGQVQSLALLQRVPSSRYAPPSDPTKEVIIPDSKVQPLMAFAPQWSNYEQVLTLQNMGRALINTSLVTVMVTLGTLFTSAVGGYAFARMNFPGRGAIFLLYLGTIMVPFVVIIIPLYQLMNAMGWINRLSSLIYPWVFSAYGTFFMRQFFQSIPKDLEEAAIVDGATRLGVLWRVFVPLSFAPLGTLATFTFLYAWNSFLWPLISISSGNKQDQVLSLALNVLRGQAAQGPGLVMAAATLSILPAMVIFIMAQRYFIEGVSTTGLAGR